MRDAEMVAAMMSGDQAGLAAAYDRYAATLYTYCRSLLMDPAQAADAVQATFLIAVAKLGQLQEPHRLQSWLYAIARNECHRQLRDQAAAAGRGEPGDAVTELAHVVADAQRSEPAELVRTAIARLDFDERDVAELSLDRALGDADLAALLGMPRDQVQQVASRARKKFEESLGTLLIARAGRERCPGLRSLLAGWDGEREEVLRASLSEHMEVCPVCREGSPPVRPRPAPPPAPRSARPGRPPLRLVTATAPPVSAERPAPGQGLLPGAWDGERGGRGKRGGPPGGTGFPAGPPSAPPGRTRRPWVAAVGLAVLAALGAGTLLLTSMQHHAGASPAGAGMLPGIDVITPGTARPVPPASHGPAPASPGVTAPAPSPLRGSGTPTPRRSAAPAPSASPSSHHPTPPPARGTLIAAPRTVTLRPAVRHGPATGSFRLTAKGGRVPSFTVTVPAAYAGVLTVAPGTGSLRAGQSVVVHVALQDAHRSGFATRLTVRPGALAVTVVFRHRHGD